MNITRLNSTPRWSDATVYNGIVHFVEVPADTSLPMLQQITQLLAQADATLAQVNSHKSRLLSATIFVSSFLELNVLNEVWESWLPSGCAPSRACLKVELVDPAMLVEIVFTAAVV